MLPWTRSPLEQASQRDLGRVWKRLVLGRALASHKAEHQLLPKLLALPVFASDQLSSVAYATEEMLLVLAGRGPSGSCRCCPLSLGGGGAAGGGDRLLPPDRAGVPARRRVLHRRARRTWACSPG